MSNEEHFKKAQEKIDYALKIGKEIYESADNLSFLKDTFSWYEKNNNSIPNVNLMEDLKDTVSSIINWDFNNFAKSDTTSSLSAALTATAVSSANIKSLEPNFVVYVKELEKINPVDPLMRQISEKLPNISEDLINEFDEVRITYSQWKENLKTNSDLAKDLRTFQDHFKGEINKLRPPIIKEGYEVFRKLSWKKLYKAIGKNGGENERTFLKQQTILENAYSELSQITKKQNRSITHDEMESLFKRCINSYYSIINTIDESCFIHNTENN